MQDVVNADSHKDELFTDAIIAEMEAGVYGLQVCFLFPFSRVIEAQFLI